MKYKLYENDKIKAVRSENYNYDFNKKTGFFARWGKTKEDKDDPQFSPIGPEILDWEISTICNQNCKFCYKSNTSNGKNIEFETFKKAFTKISRSICQIAYGIGSVSAFPRLFDILNYTRDQGIIPNITINGSATDEELEKLAMVCGAVSVSHYSDNQCYNAVSKLTEFSKRDDTTLRDVNIHQLMAAEKYDECIKVVNDIKNDERLKDLNAVVFMLLKPKGNRNDLTKITQDQFNSLISYAQEKEISIGMDSCSAPMMFKYAADNNQDEMLQSIEGCESGIFSQYWNIDCEYYPCSFSEGHGNWKKGINVLECGDFVKDIWHKNDRVIKWRDKLIKSAESCDCRVSNYCRVCPIYDITPCWNGSVEELNKEAAKNNLLKIID